MNYKNGREVKINDRVIGTGDNIKEPIVGHVIAFFQRGGGDGIRILTHLKSAHKDASTATFQTAHEFGKPENFIHADDAFKALSEKTPENKGENAA